MRIQCMFIGAMGASLATPGCAGQETRDDGDFEAFAGDVPFRGDSTTGSGRFAPVLQRTGSGWKTIHDHTSADAAGR